MLSCLQLNCQSQTRDVGYESGASAPILRAALRWCAVGAYALCHGMCACVWVGEVDEPCEPAQSVASECCCPSARMKRAAAEAPWLVFVMKESVCVLPDDPL